MEVVQLLSGGAGVEPAAGDMQGFLKPEACFAIPMPALLIFFFFTNSFYPGHSQATGGPRANAYGVCTMGTPL